MIFVSVACHDDPDVVATCFSLIKNARYPERLRIVVILQTDDLSSVMRDHGTLYGLPGIEMHVYPLAWATGVGKPRAYAVAHVREEDYFLQIDCHMRFQPDWDEKLINELHCCQAPIGLTVLSALPPGFVIASGELLSMTPLVPAPTHFMDCIPVSGANEVPADLPHPPPIACIAAGLVFCKASAIKEVPPDPFFHYHGEELSQSLRFWTRGYDCFGIRPLIAHHAYRDTNPRSGFDESNGDVMKHWRSLQRIEGLLGLKPRENLSKKALEDLDLYGLGSSRSVASWERRFGVNLATRTIS